MTFLLYVVTLVFANENMQKIVKSQDYKLQMLCIEQKYNLCLRPQFYVCQSFESSKDDICSNNVHQYYMKFALVNQGDPECGDLVFSSELSTKNLMINDICVYNLTQNANEQLLIANFQSSVYLTAALYTGQNLQTDNGIQMESQNSFIINCQNQTYLIIKGQGEFKFDYQLSNTTTLKTFTVIPNKQIGLTTIMLIVVGCLSASFLFIIIAIITYACLRCVHARAYQIRAHVSIQYDTEAANPVVNDQPIIQAIENVQKQLVRNQTVIQVLEHVGQVVETVNNVGNWDSSNDKSLDNLEDIRIQSTDRPLQEVQQIQLQPIKRKKRKTILVVRSENDEL